MTNAVATTEQEPAITAIEKAVYQGNIAELTPEQRVQYVNELCHSVGLNPLTRPVEYITLQGKLTLYVTRSGTDQLRKINGVSIIGLDTEETDDLYIVTATAQDEDGRTDFAKGVVSLKGKDGKRVQGEDYANAILKCETKAKRRVTLSICGLGFLDESETGGGREAPPQRTIEPPRALPEYVDAEPSAEAEELGRELAKKRGTLSADVADYADVETGELYESDAPEVDADDAWERIQAAMKGHGITSSQVKRVTGMTFTKDGLYEYLVRNPSESPEGIVEAAAG